MPFSASLSSVIATRTLAGDIAGTLFPSIVFRTRHDKVEVDFGITISETLAHSVRPLLDKFFHVPEPREFLLYFLCMH
ncbi:hypothetical protein BC835DRAFT_1357447, partial [Cytidiella melzeri]